MEYNPSVQCVLAKVNGRPGEEKNFYRQFSIAKYSSLPTDTFRKYVEMHVTCRKLALKFIGHCRLAYDPWTLIVTNPAGFSKIL